MNKEFECTISPTLQVIQLNDTPDPFTATVTVVAAGGAAFEMAVVDSEALSTFGDKKQAPFESAVEGVLSAAVNNRDATWFLLLKSAAETPARVSVKENFTAPAPAVSTLAAPKRFNWWIVLIIAIVVLAAAGFFVFKAISSRAAPAVAPVSVDADLLKKISELPEL